MCLSQEGGRGRGVGEKKTSGLGGLAGSIKLAPSPFSPSPALVPFPA